jgi:predicted transcriptional regulator
MDFSQDDLSDAIDRLVAQLLERAGVAEPPVDALRLAEDHIGIPVEYAEPEEDEDGRPRRQARRPGGMGLVLSPDMTDEQQQAAAAHAVARTLLPDLLRKLDITPGTESKQAAAHFRGLIAARLLVPTRMLRSALRSCKYDVPALKGVFATAAFEAVALRLLDLDDPCVIAVVDDGVVAVRRGNREPASRKLTPAEQACLDRVMELDEPQRVRAGGWTAQGWPVPDRPFRRVVLRAVPDDI